MGSIRNRWEEKGFDPALPVGGNTKSATQTRRANAAVPGLKVEHGNQKNLKGGRKEKGP